MPLPIIWKFWVVEWPVLLLWWCMGKGSFRCSLNLLPKCWRFPLCVHHEVTTLEHMYGPTFLTIMSLSLGETSRFLMMLLPTPADLFNAFAETLGVWYDYVTIGFYFIGNGLGAYSTLAVSPSLTSLVDLISLFSTLSKANLWYLQLVTFLRCSISFWRSSGLLQTVWALWVRY